MSNPGSPAGREPGTQYLVESGEFSMLAQFLASGGRVPVSDFGVGLNWLLDGFAAQIV